MPQLHHSITAALLLSSATSLIPPTSITDRRSFGTKYVQNAQFSRTCTARFMSDTRTKSPSLDEDEGTSRIYEDVDGIAGAGENNYIALDDSFIPLDPESKVIADIMAESIVTEIKNSDSVQMSKEIGEYMQETITIQEVKTETKETSSPSIRKIIQFAVPAIGVWLCGPILSLIDTAAVGLLAGTKQQAGLNPAVAICDYSALLIVSSLFFSQKIYFIVFCQCLNFYLIHRCNNHHNQAFLYTATTNLIATAQEKEKFSPCKDETANTLISSLQLSGLVGLGLGTILILTSKFAIYGIIGSNDVDPIIFSAARKYVNIRALGMPAAAIIGSAQAACLGMQDIRSPLYVLAAAAIVNFIGDAIFVGQKAAWLGGAAGAAWATVISQYTALFFFTKWLTHKTSKSKKDKTYPEVLNSGSSEDAAKRVRVTKKILRLASSSSAALDSKRKRIKNSLKKLHTSIQGTADEDNPYELKKQNPLAKFFTRSSKIKIKTTKEEQFSAKGFLSGRFKTVQYLQRPDKSLVEKFYPYVVPVTATSIGRVSAYVAMAHVVASSFGTLSMAAQQIITSFFYCLTPVADSLSLTAQSLVPRVYEKSNSPEGADDLWQTTVNFIKTGAIFGATIAAIVSCVPMLGGFFTSDLRVLELVNSVIPTISAIFFAHGIMCAAEGVLLGQKDLSFLGKAYSAFFVAIPYFMLRVKKAAIMGKNVSLVSVWQVFFGYNIIRTSLWVLRTKFRAMKNKELVIRSSVDVIS